MGQKISRKRFTATYILNKEGKGAKSNSNSNFARAMQKSTKVVTESKNERIRLISNPLILLGVFVESFGKVGVFGEVVTNGEKLVGIVSLEEAATDEE